MTTLRPFLLSPRALAGMVWDSVLAADEERVAEQARLRERLQQLEGLRAQADYNTGSVSFAAAWCLYSLVRYFAANRILEVGTFIGKSTLSMASALDDAGEPGEICTCDGSNNLVLPWGGETRIRQFPHTTSADMFKALDGTFDFAFLDGRIAAAELDDLERLLSPQAIIALDDFEGMEKGVANLSVLRSRPRFRGHALVYPAPTPLLHSHGFTSHSLTAFLLPVSRLSVVSQG